jgi:predicted amidohydrolase
MSFAPFAMRTSAEIALVQPRNWQRSWSVAWPVSFYANDPAEITQLDDAEHYVRAAASEGAEFLVFPEMYPGPRALSDTAFSPEDVRARMCRAAAAAKIWVFYCGALPVEGGQSNSCVAVNPAGEVVATYAKVLPACGERSVPAETPVVIDCDGLKVGIVICWEMWFPEIPRMAAALGADVIIAPTGGVIYELTATWKTILAARAAENTVYTAACVNLFGVEDGLCVVNSPEGLVAERTGQGLLHATLDLQRLRYLRNTDERLIVPKPYRTVPGLLRALRPSIVQRSAETVLKAKESAAFDAPV